MLVDLRRCRWYAARQLNLVRMIEWKLNHCIHTVYNILLFKNSHKIDPGNVTFELNAVD